MEHQRCYIYQPSELEERAPKRQRTSSSNPQVHLPERLQTYRELWAQQEQQIQNTLEESDSAVQERIVAFTRATTLCYPEEPNAVIPTGLIVAGPSIASHGPFFERLSRKIRKGDQGGTYVLLTSEECPNLKTLLKNLIKKATSQVEDDEDDEQSRPTASSRHGPRLLNYDLGHILEWQYKNNAKSIVVTFQDSEAFETGLLTDTIDLLHSWLDRLPFVLLFGIATSADSFEDRLSGSSLRQIQGDRFDVTQSDDIIEKVFDATVGNPDVRLHVGPNLCRRMLDRQKDHVQNVQDFCDGLKYAYMSHFYASCPSIFLREGIAFEELIADAFKAVRNLPSFRLRVEQMLDDGQTQGVREMVNSDKALFTHIIEHIRAGQMALATLGHASKVFSGIRKSLQMSPDIRTSLTWVRAASADLLGSPVLRETMLSIKKAPSDKLGHLLASLKLYESDHFTMKLSSFQQELESLLEGNDSSTPLRTQHDVRTASLRTTVVAQKVLLSKHKAALSEQDRAYSDLVTRLHDELDAYFSLAFVDPQRLFLSEILTYDLKSPHLEVFQPKPRFAVERALTSPHDYLGCDCCGGSSEKESALSSTQPATAIAYQLYLESGALMNVSDLWSAFNAIVGNSDEEDQTQTTALFQRALSELKFLGLVRPSRKKTDHIAKTMWKGL